MTQKDIKPDAVIEEGMLLDKELAHEDIQQGMNRSIPKLE